jgi:hypothetical protein
MPTRRRPVLPQLSLRNDPMPGRTPLEALHALLSPNAARK